MVVGLQLNHNRTNGKASAIPRLGVSKKNERKKRAGAKKHGLIGLLVYSVLWLVATGIVAFRFAYDTFWLWPGVTRMLVGVQVPVLALAAGTFFSSLVSRLSSHLLSESLG